MRAPVHDADLPRAAPAAGLRVLVAAFGPRARLAEPLARHTSFRIGGPADLLVHVSTVAELALVVRTATAHALPCTVLGGGSNVLVGDGGIPGVVVKLTGVFRRVAWEANGDVVVARAGAAVQLGRLARAAAARGLAGLEYAEGIPGTVGGALVMNAGAYGGEIAAVVSAVEGVDARGAARTLAGDALAFAYRRAALPAGFVVTAVHLRLRREVPAVVAARMAAARAQRLASQPQGRPNSGSMFKNPPGDYAGRLVEAAGMKGARVGRARISEKHANFIVNEGGALAADVKALMDTAQRGVWERSGVWLEPEVRLIGRW
jgi:UDP-N-acetylmuramate dehydrogenase